MLTPNVRLQARAVHGASLCKPLLGGTLSNITNSDAGTASAYLTRALSSSVVSPRPSGRHPGGKKR
jgi:hypothetical protein